MDLTYTPKANNFWGVCHSNTGIHSFEQHTTRFSESLNHLSGFFNFESEIFAQTLDAHTLGCTSVDHFFVESYVVIVERLLAFGAVGHFSSLQI